MTNTASPVIESRNENGHLVYEITVGGKVMANRYMHIVTGRHYVRDLRTDLIGIRTVDGTTDGRAAQVAFTRIYRELLAA